MKRSEERIPHVGSFPTPAPKSGTDPIFRNEKNRVRPHFHSESLQAITRLRFRAAALPETLDGIAPAER